MHFLMRINHHNNDTNNSRVALLYFTYSIVYWGKMGAWFCEPVYKGKEQYRNELWLLTQSCPCVHLRDPIQPNPTHGSTQAMDNSVLTGRF